MDKIKINFPDGSSKQFDKGITPLQVAQSISQKLADEALVARVNEKLVDLNYTIHSDASIKLFTFNDEIGKHTYWHSTSHLMAHAIQSIYPEAKFGVGPAIEGGFYYDFDIKTQLNDGDLLKIEQKMMDLAAED